jgi:hypothetical protein
MADEQNQIVQELTDKVRRLEATQEVLVEQVTKLARTLFDFLNISPVNQSLTEGTHGLFAARASDRTYRTKCDDVIQALKRI